MVEVLDKLVRPVGVRLINATNKYEYLDKLVRPVGVH